MPQCRLCGAPIFFLTEEPRDVKINEGYPPKVVRTEPKPHPIDVNPSPAGNISIYPYHGGKTYFRRQYGLVPEMLRRYGSALYTSHFDTCPNRRRS